MYVIQRLHNAFQTRRFPFAHMRAGMSDEIRNLQGDTAAEFFDEQIDALAAQIRNWRSEVDQVAVVADGFLEFQAIAIGSPGCDCRITEGRASPLLLILGED